MKTIFKSRFAAVHVPTLVWAVLILSVSSIPHLKSPHLGFSMQDKVAHAIVYGILGILLSRSFASAGILHWAPVAIVLGMGYGALDEWHQQFIPGREASIGDWAADAAGVLIGAVLYRLFKTRSR